MKIWLSIALIIVIANHQTAEASAVGRTAGQFNVSAVGSAQYRIPIWAPPGPRGMQPNLALVYDSHSGIGPLGIGWSLGGLSAVTRCNLTVAQDTTPAPVALVTTDGYCLNGNRLRLTAGTYGTAGSTYQTEIADFSNITANGTAGNGPQYFVVQGRNGLTYYYGYTDSNGNGANSEVLANGTTTALTWLLSKVVDRAGNNFVVNYTALTGTAVPYRILWTPVSAGSSSYSYTMQFNYTANVPQSSINAYVAGTLVSNTELLSSIEIFSGSTVVKDYFLAYQASPLTGREELHTVTECADSGESNCLLPTTISYQGGSPGLSTTSNTALNSSGTNLTARYDLNGDGYPDIVYANSVSFGSASGYGTPVSIGVFPNLIGNVTGGTQDGILTQISGYWWYYTWNGSSFVGTSTGLAVDSTATYWQLADVDGDGKPDLVGLFVKTVIKNGIQHTTTSVKYYLNTSSGSTASFNPTLAGATIVPNGSELFTADFQYGKLRRFDFNGDGRDDLVIVYGVPGNPATIYTSELISNGSGFTIVQASSQPGTTYTPVFFTNWNDDKCTDLVAANTLIVSGCNGTVPQTYSISGTILGAMDWDGDGRTDLIVANGSTLGVYLSKATGAPTLTSTSIPYSSTCQYVWMDANGDGLDDFGCWSQTSGALTYYLHNGTSDLATTIADGYGNSASPTYVSIAQSNYTEHGYGEATFPDADYIGPMFVVSKAVFSDASAAPGVTYNQTFQYFGAWINLQGRGFDGFGATYVLDSRNGVGHSRYYQRAFPYTGMMYEDVVWNTSPFFTQAFSTATFTTLSTTTNQQRYFPYFNNSTVQKWEAGGTENGDLITTTSTNYTFDNYGNATNIVTTVTDNDPGSPYNGYTWTTNTTNTMDVDGGNQSADLAQWCLTMPDETQVAYSSTLSGSTAVTRTKTFTPDTPANCRIVSTVTEPTANSGLYKVTEALTFDSFGNIQTDTVTGANMPSSPASREIQFNWGTTGQFVNTLTDPSNATTTFSYTSNQSLAFGVPDSVKNANNLTTSWVYDAFGRKTKETRPDGTSTTWTWSTCTSYCGWSNSFYQIAQAQYQTNGTTVIRTDTNYYDPIDRVTETSGPTVTGATAIVQKLYNSLGLLTQQSMPFLSGGTAYQQTFAYDALNRLSSVTRPISSTNSSPQSTTYAYAGRKLTVTDPLGNTKTTVNDVNGWLRRTQDGIGYMITRAFDAAGSLIGVTDSVGNTLLSGVTYAYGLKPFRLASTDADRGAWTFTVDSLGERTGWTDAKGQSFSMSYDALSRPLSRTEQDLYTQWTWGATPANHNVGQLITECTGTGNTCASSAYSESRTFDSYGRPYQRSITQGGNPGNNPGGVFLFTSAYSSTTGLLNSLTYPISTSGVALNVQYGYQNGLLQSVTDTTDTTGTCGSTCTLWTANAMNAFSEITQETLGNGVVTNRTYDAVTSWLSAATAGVGGGAGLLNQSYAEDKNGNIIQRQDNKAGLTENLFYDADQRLTCAVLTSNCSTSTLVYDGGVAGPGNITTQIGVGTYSYPAAGQPRPHAVSSITGTFNGIVNPSFSYDANGNMTARAGSTVSWSSYNYPTAISASDVTGSEEVQFLYGPDRQRWKQIYTSPTPTETTYYVGGLMDVVFVSSTTNYRHYIYAGKEPVAVYSRTAAGVNTMSYMLEDHEGSVSTIASKSGAVDVNESFSAFGTRRNPATWSGAPTTADLNAIAGLSRQGYTFQTWLGQSMGLNHMNGRVQDAILGRFLSPDPHITDPTNAQNYNRYSYANNNPVSNTDPTGFDPCPGLTEGDCSIAPPDPGPVPTMPAIAPPSALDAPGVAPTVCIGNCGNFGFNSPPPGQSGAPKGGVPLGSGVDLNYVAPATTAYGDPTQFDTTPAVDQWLANNMPNALSPGSGSSSIDSSVDSGNFSFGNTSVQSGNLGSVGGFMNSGSNFINAAEGFVASTTAITAGAGAIYAFGELGTVAVTGVGVDGFGSILLATGAASDVGGMAIVGGSLGMAGGFLMLPAFGVGYAFGTFINPYVQPIISSWYGY
jgi:RHS repeat-associated protein